LSQVGTRKADELKWELLGETERKADLVRWGIFFKEIKKYYYGEFDGQLTFNHI
jgi:hypothetical protein